MKNEIIDNWLEPFLSQYLKEHFKYKIPHWWGHVSDPQETNMMYNCDLNPNDTMNAYLFNRLCFSLNKKLKLIRMYLNIQHPGMEGVFHTDDGTITCIYMVTDTLKNSGYFEIKNEKKIEFIHNRLIAFDAKKWHKGHAPKKDIRITLAFKCKEEIYE